MGNSIYIYEDGSIGRAGKGVNPQEIMFLPVSKQQKEDFQGEDPNQPSDLDTIAEIQPYQTISITEDEETYTRCMDRLLVVRVGHFIGMYDTYAGKLLVPPIYDGLHWIYRESDETMDVLIAIADETAVFYYTNGQQLTDIEVQQLPMEKRNAWKKEFVDWEQNGIYKRIDGSWCRGKRSDTDQRVRFVPFTYELKEGIRKQPTLLTAISLICLFFCGVALLCTIDDASAAMWISASLVAICLLMLIISLLKRPTKTQYYRMLEGVDSIGYLPYYNFVVQLIIVKRGNKIGLFNIHTKRLELEPIYDGIRKENNKIVGFNL